MFLTTFLKNSWTCIQHFSQDYDLASHTNVRELILYMSGAGTYSEWKIFFKKLGNFIYTLMVFSFLQRMCHPLTRWIKKLLTSPVIVSFFIWEGRNTNIKKGYACVYHLIRSVARSILFPLHILSTCFYKPKNIFLNPVLILNANFLYYWQCSLNNVMFP